MEQNFNNNIKRCPYCNETMSEEIFNDHLMCHQLQNEENNNNPNNINYNQNQNNYNSQYVNERNNREQDYSNNINNNNQNGENGNFFSKIIDFFNISSESQNNNNQVNSNNSSNINNNNENNNNPGFFNSLIGRNPNRNNNIPQSNSNNSSINNNINNFNNNSQSEGNNLFGGINSINISDAINSLENKMKNLTSSLLNGARSNEIIRTTLLDNNPLRIMRNNQQRNNNDNNNNQNNNENTYNNGRILYVPVSRSSLNPSFIIMSPVIIGEPGHIFDANDPNNGLNYDINNNISNEDLNRIMEYLPSTIINEKKEGENNNCVICLGDFEGGDSVTTLPCVHMFHTECIKNWLQSKNHCPVCKYEITLNSIMREN